MSRRLEISQLPTCRCRYTYPRRKEERREAVETSILRLHSRQTEGQPRDMSHQDNNLPSLVQLQKGSVRTTARP
jgi:hypothetical protein